jgi:hypothetical protein
MSGAYGVAYPVEVVEHNGDRAFEGFLKVVGRMLLPFLKSSPKAQEHSVLPDLPEAMWGVSEAYRKGQGGLMASWIGVEEGQATLMSEVVPLWHYLEWLSDCVLINSLPKKPAKPHRRYVLA